MRTIIALIPVRSGSKSIPNKNIIDFKGKPLFVHSIEQALSSKYITEVFVSTDSQKYQDIALKNRALAPFLRPKEISQDNSTDFETFEHFIKWLKDNHHKKPDLIVHLRATYPTRSVVDIDRAIEEFLDNFDSIDSLRSVVEAPITPYKMWSIEKGFLKPLLNVEGLEEPYNQARQTLPTVYWQNACIDIVKVETIEDGSMSGDVIYPFIMKNSEVHDIDDLIDLEKAKRKSEC